MFKYLSAICPLVIIIPFFGSDPLYPISISFIFAVLGTIFGVISTKKEEGILGKIALFVNALFLLIGILMLLFSVFWIIGGRP